jgi:arylsulfatase A-like enzyme
MTNSCAGRKEQGSVSLPNILFIMSDDHASQGIGVYNSWLSDVVNTPHIDRIAHEGMMFENCFVTNSICTPSRATILTGKYGHKNGCPSLDQTFDGSQQTFPKLLQKAGYHTAVVGKWHLGSEPTGFDYYNVLPGQGKYFDPDLKEKGDPWVDGFDGGKPYRGYVTDVITDLAINHLENRPKDKPFCMLLHHKGPHDMWDYDPKYDTLYSERTMPEPPNFYEDYTSRGSLQGNEFKMGGLDFQEYWGDQVKGLEGDEKRSAYYQIFIKWFLRCAQSVDDNVGRILDYLDREGLSENTVVIYTSDQGAFLGEHGLWDKRLMYEESIRMPFLIRYPALVRAGSSSDQIISNIDFAETILDLAGIEVPRDMQGTSFVPLLEGVTSQDWDNKLYYHYSEPGAPPAHLGIRTARYKLIYFYGLAVDIRNEQGELEIGGGEPEWELFDLVEDPSEMHNLYSDPEYSLIREELKEQLLELMDQYEEDPHNIPGLVTLKKENLAISIIN